MTDDGQDLRLIPLDFVILDMLPGVGVVGGVHWRGRPARDVIDEVIETTGTTLPRTTLSARFRSLRHCGLVRQFPAGSGDRRVWAATEKGQRVLAERDRYMA